MNKLVLEYLVRKNSIILHFMLIASVFAVIWIEFVNVKIPVSSFT